MFCLSVQVKFKLEYEVSHHAQEDKESEEDKNINPVDLDKYLLSLLNLFLKLSFHLLHFPRPTPQETCLDI